MGIVSLAGSHWPAGDPVLAVGEIGIDTATGLTRIGDGATPWSGLSPVAGPAEPLSRVVNTQTDDYALALADAGQIVAMNKASANTLTVPTNASVAFPVGTVIEIEQIGAGTTTISAAGGVTVNAVGGTLAISAQYGSARLVKRAANIWDLVAATASGGGASGPPDWFRFKVIVEGVDYYLQTTAVVGLAPQGGFAQAVSFMLSGGPFVIGAGGVVSLSSADGALTAGAALVMGGGESELQVANAAGTQLIAVENLACADLLAGGGEVAVGLDSGNIDKHIGSDLSINGSHQVMTAAGGVFWITFHGQATYTSPA